MNKLQILYVMVDIERAIIHSIKTCLSQPPVARCRGTAPPHISDLPEVGKYIEGNQALRNNKILYSNVYTWLRSSGNEGGGPWGNHLPPRMLELGGGLVGEGTKLESNILFFISVENEFFCLRKVSDIKFYCVVVFTKQYKILHNFMNNNKNVRV